MSGGISAIKGFDYQATVTLDCLFDHFDRHGATATVRPEGTDDLDLFWTAGVVEHRHYIQIKKPKEDEEGHFNPSPWTLNAAIAKLFPNTILHLMGNQDTQAWILGDEVVVELSSLVDAGENAPGVESHSYWAVVHQLALNDTIGSVDLQSSSRKELRSWRLPSCLSANPETALLEIVAGFSDVIQRAGAGGVVASQYQHKVVQLHACLPQVLARTEIVPTYGTEQDVVQRVYDRLERRYKLQRSVIENTLFRNMRGFIYDISKQPGRRFDQIELETELRSVWPQMMPIREAPPLAPDHIERLDLVQRFTTGKIGRMIEAVGVSGSGKTMLAAEVITHLHIYDPDCLTYYAEVRPTVRFRDVLAGVAFHLRRTGISEPFAVSIQPSLADEEVLAVLARSFSSIPREILLVIDLVEGTCNSSFARDLATFVRALTTSACRIAAFGQESVACMLSQLERDEYGVSRLDIRGFSFKEFVALVAHNHPNPDSSALWNIFQRVTAGRAAGLFAKLAQSLARADSMEEMSAMSMRPAEDILPHAEQQRFLRISDGSRSAAEKLVCFALPFRRKDAEEIFPNDNIGAAIRELLMLGLLRHSSEDTLEMHETVRAGLESLIAANARQSAHEALAVWYGHQGSVTAETFHLEKAGRQADARRRARQVFLRGECWSALSSYVTVHRLVSIDEIIGVATGLTPIKGIYILSNILRTMEGSVDVDALFRSLHEQPDRICSDHQWALAIIEAILEFDPERLCDLIIFSVETISDVHKRETVLAWLILAARRKNGVIGPSVIRFFDRQIPEIKRELLNFMLLDRSRQALQRVFEFLEIDPKQPNRRSTSSLLSGLSLQIDSRADAIEFLAAMPQVSLATILVAKSALLGPLVSIVWSQRNVLRPHCVELLRDSTAEDVVLKNAIRILVFLADPSIGTLCDPLLARKDCVGEIAKLIPALLPALYDLAPYEVRFLDNSLALQDRVTALGVLASAGVDLGPIYRRVQAAEIAPQEAKFWDFCFLILCAQAPFPDAIPILEAHLKSADEKDIGVVLGSFEKLGALRIPQATEMLARALNHAEPRVRRWAAMALSRRRSRRALASLVDCYVKEENETLAVSLATAIIASGPRSMENLRGSCNSDTTQLWQCILAMRLRELSTADQLVTLANDTALNWQLRRTAIFAAGRLPYEAALERIVPVIMAERSPLTIDSCSSFCCHAVISSILLTETEVMAYFFARGRSGFVDFYGEVFESRWRDSIFPQGLPSGNEAAGWLFDRLTHHGWPANPAAPDLTINELSIPMLHSAVLRSLRLARRPDIIEEHLLSADHVWFAMKCLIERSKVGKRDSELVLRLKNLVESSPCKGNSLLHRGIAGVNGCRSTVSTGRPTVAADQMVPVPAPYVIYSDIVRALSGVCTSLNVAFPFVLEPITAEQYEHLIRLADPVNDRSYGIETYVPMFRFTQGGHVVAQQQVSFKGGTESINKLIRPAIAAANDFDLPIPWHQELLSGAFAATYLSKYLACLAARNVPERFYKELELNADAVFPHICSQVHATPVLKFIDERIVPFLARYVSSGTDELFEGLCTLALKVNTPEIDAVLAGLFHRWTQRFDTGSPLLQHNENYSLWRGFDRLAEHPRFDKIDGWQPRLESVLHARMSGYHAENIVRVLERDPRSYILIESRLFKVMNWEHFYHDEIDRLDEAAERLFTQLLED